jgi:(2S)-methylsuccinyl-CoA dehydrogenase
VVQKRVAAASLDTEQHAAHGYAWIETSVEALRALLDWGKRQVGDAEALVVAIGTGETLAPPTVRGWSNCLARV